MHNHYYKYTFHPQMAQLQLTLYILDVKLLTRPQPSPKIKLQLEQQKQKKNGFQIYLVYIMPKNINTFVTYHTLQRCNMSHFEKIEKFTMSSGVNFFKHGLIFEVRAKSSCQNLLNWIQKILTRGFVPNFKNEAMFEKFNATLFL